MQRLKDLVRDGNASQQVKGSPNLPQTTSSVSSISKMGMGVQACNPSPQEEEGGRRIWKSSYTVSSKPAQDTR